MTITEILECLIRKFQLIQNDKAVVCGNEIHEVVEQIKQWALENLVFEEKLIDDKLKNGNPFGQAVDYGILKGFNMARQELIDRINKIGGEK